MELISETAIKTETGLDFSIKLLKQINACLFWRELRCALVEDGRINASISYERNIRFKVVFQTKNYSQFCLASSPLLSFLYLYLQYIKMYIMHLSAVFSVSHYAKY